MKRTLRLRLAAATAIALGAAASHPAPASATMLKPCAGTDWRVAMDAVWSECLSRGYSLATLDACSNDGSSISWEGTCYS